MALYVHRSVNQIELERKWEPRESCFRWERLKCAWAVRRRTRSQWKGKQRESQSRREHQVTERGGWWGQIWGRKGAAKGKGRNVLFCQSLLGREQRAPVQSQNGGEDERGNQLYHKISRSRRAEEGKWMLEGGHGWQDGLGDLR